VIRLPPLTASKEIRRSEATPQKIQDQGSSVPTTHPGKFAAMASPSTYSLLHFRHRLAL